MTSTLTPGPITKQTFGNTQDGEAELYTLTNAQGMKVRITTYGAAVTELIVPDKKGNPVNVVLGFDNVSRYQSKENPHMGCIVGRVANRIAGGQFVLDGKIYKTPINNGPNTLHGGIKGFTHVLWKAQPVESAEGQSLVLSYVSPDGEEGFPGTMTAQVIYTLTADNALKIAYRATCDKPTLVNLTNHCYFNLAGAGNGNILGHELTIAADAYTPVDADLIPTGKIKPVAGTPLDFSKPRTIGAQIAEVPGGYDHNYVLNSQSGELARAAQVLEPASGRTMEVWTTEPGVQLYTSNGMPTTLRGNGGNYGPHAALCLETQHFPDAVHHKNFPSTELRPGQVFQSTTLYKFGQK